MRRYAEVQNPAPVVCQNQEHVQDLKPHHTLLSPLIR